MLELPSGTVTFLFTDIEGSTNLAESYPSALPNLIARHNAILQDAIETNRGSIFRIAGDAFCAAFYTPSDGLEAALQAQRHLQHEQWIPAPVLVRMGIHTGEARRTTTNVQLDPYVGYLTLTRVQRVMSTAHGGQILVSNPTATLVRSDLPPHVFLRDMGDHKLKGLLQPELLWQVVAPDLRQDFAPLQTLDAVPNNLPKLLSSLIGRERELLLVKQRLSETRLVTLLGPGGTGKTRLALQAATELLTNFEDRVYFVDLAASRDADAVLAALARMLGVRETTDRPLVEELKAHIRGKRMLCLLDNFEQVIVAAPIVVELLSACPGLEFLVTSREALHVRGEVVLPIPPLALPDLGAREPSLAQIAQSPAVQLFVERARAVKPDFVLNGENAQAIAQICARLDGLPLAIELATARLNLFTPHALADRLANRLKLLRGGASDLPERQQTLSSTIDWSYDLLKPAEQDLFKFLCVFAGASVEAIETTAGQVKRIQASGLDVLSGVSSLVDKSLLRQMETADGEPRLRMLETIREFAMARLDEDQALRGEARHAHARYFADFTQQQWEPLTGPSGEQALGLLNLELPNIRAAWNYWAEEKNVQELGKFTDSLWTLYDARGWYHDTVQLASDLLRVIAETPNTPERAREEILLQTSLARALLASKGYTVEVEQAYARALELCKQLGDVPQLFPVLRGLSTFYILSAEYDKGLEIGRRILELAETLDDDGMRVAGHLVRGENLGFVENVPVGLAEIDKGLAAFDPTHQHVRRRQLGANTGVVALVVSAIFQWGIGLTEQSGRRAQQAIQVARALDHPFSIAYAEFHYSFLQLWLGNPERAYEHARMVMDMADDFDFDVWKAVAACVRGAAMLSLGSPEEGRMLIEQGMQAYRGLKSPPVFLPLIQSFSARAHLVLGDPGKAMPLIDEALAQAAGGRAKTLGSEFMALKGDLLLAQSADNAAEAENWYRLAVDNARQVQAPLMELRAAMPLVALLHSQGKTEEARRVLSEPYSKLTEGFDCPDVRQARELLRALE